jgi:hypothetical protein
MFPKRDVPSFEKQDLKADGYMLNTWMKASMYLESHWIRVRVSR